MRGTLATLRFRAGRIRAETGAGGSGSRWVRVALAAMVAAAACTGPGAEEPDQPEVAWAAGVGAREVPVDTSPVGDGQAPALANPPAPGDEGSELAAEAAAPPLSGSVPADPAPTSVVATREPQEPWARITAEDIERDVYFQRLPPDAGLVAPVARLSDRYDSFVVEHLDCIETMLADWGPARHDDPVQRVRNLLYVAAAPDVLQLQQIESVVPLVVFDWLQREIPSDQLSGLLYWIALHPFDGDDSAAGQLHGACLDIDAPEDRELLRYRAGMYAAKLLGRVTGHLPVR